MSRHEQFPRDIRQAVRHEQDHRCAICRERGHLTIHHKVPQCQGGPSTIDNAVGLCRTPCHDHVDRLTITHGIPFETIMEEGVSYLLSTLSDHPEQAKSSGTLPHYPQIETGQMMTFQDEAFPASRGYYPFAEALRGLVYEDVDAL